MSWGLGGRLDTTASSLHTTPGCGPEGLGCLVQCKVAWLAQGSHSGAGAHVTQIFAFQNQSLAEGQFPLSPRPRATRSSSDLSPLLLLPPTLTPRPRPSYQLCAHRHDHGCGHSLAYPLSPVRRIKGPTVSPRECQPKPHRGGRRAGLPLTSTRSASLASPSHLQ